MRVLRGDFEREGAPLALFRQTFNDLRAHDVDASAQPLAVEVAEGALLQELHAAVHPRLHNTEPVFGASFLHHHTLDHHLVHRVVHAPLRAVCHSGCSMRACRQFLGVHLPCV